MRWLVVYATAEGQTAQVATALASRLERAGAEVSLREIRRARDDVEMTQVDRVLVAAPVHRERLPHRMVVFCRRHARDLARRDAVLVSVSLSAAGDVASDWVGLERAVDDFARRTRWRPAAVHHVAGALAFSRYDPLTRWLMRRIARRRGVRLRGEADREFTDWQEVNAIADALGAEAA